MLLPLYYARQQCLTKYLIADWTMNYLAFTWTFLCSISAHIQKPLSISLLKFNWTFKMALHNWNDSLPFSFHRTEMNWIHKKKVAKFIKLKIISKSIQQATHSRDLNKTHEIDTNSILVHLNVNPIPKELRNYLY